MTLNEQLIVEIEKALNNETTAPWKVTEWLRALLEENKRLKSWIETLQLGNEIEKERFRTELSAKDKVLEWYASFGLGGQDAYDMDIGEEARSVLSQYKGEDTSE